MKDRNSFNGKNPHGLYVPMSDDEQDALERMVSSKDLELVIHGWGILQNPRIQFGDFRVRIDFRLDFNAPEHPINVHFFDLELKVRGTQITLFKKRMPIMVNGQPIQVQAGMYLEMAWDIAIDHMDPKLVKMYLPGLRGKTSSRLDKDTGERTLLGNMNLNSRKKWELQILEQQAAKVRKDDVAAAIDATQKSGAVVKNGPKGPEAPDVT